MLLTLYGLVLLTGLYVFGATNDPLVGCFIALMAVSNIFQLGWGIRLPSAASILLRIISFFGNVAFLIIGFILVILGLKSTPLALFFGVIFLLASGCGFAFPYGGRQRKHTPFSGGVRGENSLEWWGGYYAQNQEAIDALEKELNSILVEKYRVRPEYVANIRRPGTVPPFKVATLAHFNKRTAAQGAEDFYKELQIHGIAGNPAIFMEDAAISQAKWRLLVFGAYQPTASQKGLAAVVWSTLALMLHAGASVMFSPTVDLFMPTEEWLYGGAVLSVVLSICSVIWSVWAQKTGRILSKIPTGSRLKALGHALFMLVLGIPFLSLLYCVALIYGAGEILTEIAGTSGKQAYMVTRDVKIDHKVGRHGHVQAFCVNSKDFRRTLDGYCLQQEHYNMLPDTETEMTFLVVQSPLGTVVKGYVPPVQKAP